MQASFSSTGLDRNIYRVDVYFTVRNSIPLSVWSGMYLYRELLKIFERASLRFDHKSRKPFTISPIVDTDNDRCIDIGVLEPDRVYRFRFSTLDTELLEVFGRAIYESQDIFNVIRTETSSTSLSIPSLSPKLSGISRYAVLIDIIFLPTIFRFRGHTILYPSPQRFLASIFRDLCIATGSDLREYLKNFVQNFELMSYRTKLAKLYIGKNNRGVDRYISVFHGKVRYITVIVHHYIQLLNLLLNVARNLGVGKNRAIGLGNVHIIKVNAKAL